MTRAVMRTVMIRGSMALIPARATCAILPRSRELITAARFGGGRVMCSGSERHQHRYAAAIVLVDAGVELTAQPAFLEPRLSPQPDCDDRREDDRDNRTV